jgi:hypothetical protein
MCRVHNEPAGFMEGWDFLTPKRVFIFMKLIIVFSYSLSAAFYDSAP